MDLSIFGPFLQIFNILKVVFGHLWQFIVPPFLFLIAFISWVYYRQGQYARSLKFILLNINVSGENIRTAFAAEQIMAGLHGVLSPRDPVEKYWLGEFQEAFSFEIVGINGHVNFVIRTPEQFRDLVEAHVYAQYPEAEIAEVQDYAGEIPDEITAADSPWEIWGTEMTLAREDAYPIKTYVDIEMATQAAPDEAKLDPLAGLLEVMSNLREGEQMWMQIIAEPTDDSWKDEGEALVRKLIGVKEPKKKSGVLKDFVNEWTEVLVQGVTQAPFAPPTFAAKSEEKDEGPHSLMQFLSPGEQEAVKAIQRNISKVGYRNKIRMIYLARKDVYDKSVLKSRSAAFIGAFTQFATTNLNTFKLTRKTLAHYWFPSR
ncbi:hypothetical protein COT68_00125, partial [bacterium (Candidatus Torokbacteria) CG09_land_8_20_14_0_10_42_11]